jgi:hypothetical protein
VSFATSAVTYNPPGRPHPLNVEALLSSIYGLACSLKSGRNFGAGLSGFQEIIQFLLLGGGPWAPCWR